MRRALIYFVRHGETGWNLEKKTQGHTDISLNASGRKQAFELASRIKNLKINKIISSDLKRAKETAEIIGETIGCSNLEFDSRLREFNYGVLEGVCRNELTPETWEIFNNHPEKLKAESFKEIFTRIKNFFDESNFNLKDNVLIVAHGGSLRVIKYYLENKTFDEEKYFKFYKDLKIKNVYIFEWDGDIINFLEI